MPDIEALISKYVKKGVDHSTIIRSFKKAGYKKTDIQRALEKYHYHSGHSHWKAALVVAIPTFLLIAFFLLPSEKDCGEDLSCFVAAANACEDAVVYTTIDQTQIRYETDGCILTKEIGKFAPAEPEEIRVLFEGRQMACPYEEGNFDPDLLRLTGNLEQCEGELKDMIVNVRLAQLQ